MVLWSLTGKKGPGSIPALSIFFLFPRVQGVDEKLNACTCKIVSCQRTQIEIMLVLAVLPGAIIVLNKLSLRGEGEENKQVHLRSIHQKYDFAPSLVSKPHSKDEPNYGRLVPNKGGPHFWPHQPHRPQLSIESRSISAIFSSLLIQ